MSNVFYRAGTVLAPTGSSKHLFVICNDPVYDPVLDDYCCLVVSVSSVKNGKYDPTCILHVGDHDFIKHDSYVYYKQAGIWRMSIAKKRVESGDVIPYGTMEESAFERVLDGFHDSNQVVLKVRKFIDEYIK